MPTFSASLPPVLTGKTVTLGGKVFVDGLNKQPLDIAVSVTSDDGFDINGWAFDDKTKTAPKLVFIELESVKGGGKYYASAERRERERISLKLSIIPH